MERYNKELRSCKMVIQKYRLFLIRKHECKVIKDSFYFNKYPHMDNVFNRCCYCELHEQLRIFETEVLKIEHCIFIDDESLTKHKRIKKQNADFLDRRKFISKCFHVFLEFLMISKIKID